jgi:hypothetical protein
MDLRRPGRISATIGLLALSREDELPAIGGR